MSDKIPTSDEPPTHEDVYREALSIGKSDLARCIKFLGEKPTLPQKANDNLALELLTRKVLPNKRPYDFFAKRCSAVCMRSVIELLRNNDPDHAGLIPYYVLPAVNTNSK